jgi:hypothetical protein
MRFLTLPSRTRKASQWGEFFIFPCKREALQRRMFKVTMCICQSRFVMETETHKKSFGAANKNGLLDANAENNFLVYDYFRIHYVY